MITGMSVSGLFTKTTGFPGLLFWPLSYIAEYGSNSACRSWISSGSRSTSLSIFSNQKSIKTVENSNWIYSNYRRLYCAQDILAITLSFRGSNLTWLILLQTQAPPALFQITTQSQTNLHSHVKLFRQLNQNMKR